MYVPFRHNLVNWSCANNGIEFFHRKLEKIMKYQKHVTSHGLHMNKLSNCQANCGTCTTIFQGKEIASILVHWKDKHSVTDNNELHSFSDNNKKENTIIDQSNEPVRMSKRNRKPPIIKTDDFLL